MQRVQEQYTMIRCPPSYHILIEFLDMSTQVYANTSYCCLTTVHISIPLELINAI